MKGALASIRLNLASPRDLAQSVLDKLVEVYMHMRNRTPLHGRRSIPEVKLAMSVPEADREAEQQRLKDFQRKKSTSVNHRPKLDWLHGLIDHYGLSFERLVLKSAERTIKAYEMEAISAAEEAFVNRVNRKTEPLSLPYFSGIVKPVQQDRDDEAYRRYCHDRYDHQAMKEAQRPRHQQAPQTPTVSDFVAILEQAVSASVQFVKETAIRQARRMTQTLLQTYCYWGALKKQIFDGLGQLAHFGLAQKLKAWELIEQFLSPEPREESVILKP